MKSVHKFLLLAAASVAAGVVSGADTKFVDPDKTGDIALESAWGGTYPGTTSKDNAVFTDVNGILTASKDMEFGIMKFSRSELSQMTLVLDMRTAADADPRQIKLLGMNISSKNTALELKSGLWDFYTTASYPDWNVIKSAGTSNVIVTLSSGAIVTNIAYAGYSHFNSGTMCSGFRLVGGSKWYNRSSFWPFKGGSRNTFEILDGSSVIAPSMTFGRLDASSTAISSNRLVVGGQGSTLQVNGTAHFGGSSFSNTGGSNGHQIFVTNKAAVVVTGASYVGCQTRRNSMLIGDLATVTGNGFYIGYSAASSNNIVCVEGGSTLSVSSLIVGGDGSSGNALIVSNATLSASSEVRFGDNYQVSTRGGSNNLIRVVGPDAKFSMNSSIFGRGDCNTFELDGATLSGSGNIEFSIDWGAAANRYSNHGNTVRLKNGSSLSVGNFRVGMSTDRGGNTLNISEASHLSATWIMVYSNDVVRIKIPKEGLSRPAVNVDQYMTFRNGSILDIDTDDWTEGKNTCELMRTLGSAATYVSVSQATLDATNARLGGKFVVSMSADGRAIQIHRKRGMCIIFR